MNTVSDGLSLKGLGDLQAVQQAPVTRESVTVWGGEGWRQGIRCHVYHLSHEQCTHFDAARGQPGI